MEAHRTQAHDLIFSALDSDEERWAMLSTEHYILAAAHSIDLPRQETDLFDGIDP